MKKIASYLRDCAVTALLLLLAFAVSLLCQKLDVEEHTTTVFVFAVFLISLVTNGYLYGLLAADMHQLKAPADGGICPRQREAFRCGGIWQR